MNREVEIKTYHFPGGVELKIHILRSEDADKEPSPAIIGFHGGSWIKGEPQSWYALSEYFLKAGMTVFLPQYRLLQTHEVSILDLIDDARTAVDWVHRHAGDYHLDRTRIGLAGGSAGGHLAVNTWLNQDGIKLPKPAFFLLGNPVIDSTETGYGSSFCGKHAKAVSPLHQVASGLPPTLILHGSADTTTPVEGVREFQKQATANGDICELIEYGGETHGFFNKPENHASVSGAMIRFLQTNCPPVAE